MTFRFVFCFVFSVEASATIACGIADPVETAPKPSTVVAVIPVAFEHRNVNRVWFGPATLRLTACTREPADASACEHGGRKTTWKSQDRRGSTANRNYDNYVPTSPERRLTTPSRRIPQRTTTSTEPYNMLEYIITKTMTPPREDYLSQNKAGTTNKDDNENKDISQSHARSTSQNYYRLAAMKEYVDDIHGVLVDTNKTVEK